MEKNKIFESEHIEGSNYHNHLFVRIGAKRKVFTKVNFSHTYFEHCYFRDCTFDSCNFNECKIIN